MERVSHERRRSVNFIVCNLKRRSKYRESAHQRKTRPERKQRIQSIVIRVRPPPPVPPAASPGGNVAGLVVKATYSVQVVGDSPKLPEAAPRRSMWNKIRKGAKTTSRAGATSWD